MASDNPLSAPHPNTDAETFIQWKGTDVCMDFHCPCGAHAHYDGDFAYSVRCPNCDRTFDLGTQVRVIETTNPLGEPKVLDVS